MIDKFAQALILMREAFEDAQTGASVMAPGALAVEVEGAQRVINAASAVQVLRVAQYAGREEEQDASGTPPTTTNSQPDDSKGSGAATSVN